MTKYIVFSLCFLLSQSRFLPLKDWRGTYIMGVVFGIGADKQSPTWFQCKSDFGHELSIPDQMVDLIKLGEYEQAIEHFITQLNKMVGTCGQFLGEYGQYLSGIKEIISGEDIKYKNIYQYIDPNFKRQAELRIIQNARVFAQDILKHQKALKQNNLFEAGYSLGEMMSIILWNKTNPL